MTESSDSLEARRERMVAEQIIDRGITDPEVVRAFLAVKRHLFVPDHLVDRSYDDGPLPIGQQQTISQPYVIALMLASLELRHNQKVLEIGSGSGYVAALLGEICHQVFAIERLAELANVASDRLIRLGYDQVQIRCADGCRGWPEEAPFDRIIISAAASSIPRDLIKQLALGGLMVLPFGSEGQQKLILLSKTPDGIMEHDLGKVSFVPLVGAS